jgi:hypothetical protein
MNAPAILFRIGFVGLLLAALAGCSSMNKPSSDSFASVVITNTTAVAICKTTCQVFREAEYRVAMESPKDRKLVFEKEGTRGQNLAYNGIWGAQNGQVVLERVKAKIYERGDGSFRLSCEAFVIPDATSITPEHEIRVGNMRSGPYQKLLDDVASRLDGSGSDKKVTSGM